MSKEKMKTKYEYIQMIETEKKPKTSVFEIVSVSHGDILEEIRWHWRQYCFFPEGDTIWNRACMRDVQHFINQLMDIRKKGSG